MVASSAKYCAACLSMFSLKSPAITPAWMTALNNSFHGLIWFRTTVHTRCAAPHKHITHRMMAKVDEEGNRGESTSEVAALCEAAGEEARPAAQVQ